MISPSRRIRASPPRNPPETDCPLDSCLSLLGKRWSAKVLWFLRCGPRRFGDLKRDLGGISTKVLTLRLRELERAGVIARAATPRPLSPGAAPATQETPLSVSYSLTTLGEGLSPVLDAMAQAAKKLTRAEQRRG